MQAVNVIVPLITVTADKVPHLSTQRILHSDNEVEETYKQAAPIDPDEKTENNPACDLFLDSVSCCHRP